MQEKHFECKLQVAPTLYLIYPSILSTAMQSFLAACVCYFQTLLTNKKKTKNAIFYIDVVLLNFGILKLREFLVLSRTSF